MKKRHLTKALAFVLTLAMVMGLVPGAAIADPDPAPALTDDGEKLYVNLASNDDLTLDVSDKATGFEFHVFDDGGEGSNYSANCDGSLTVTGPTGFVLKLEGWINVEHSYDYVYLYNGSEADDSIKIGRYTSSCNLSPIYTGGNSAIYMPVPSLRAPEYFASVSIPVVGMKI